MKQIAFSFFLVALSFTLCIASRDKGVSDETLVNVPKLAPTDAAKGSGKSGKFDIEEVCKQSTAAEKCNNVLKSLGGDKDNVKPSKFSDKVVKYVQGEFGKASTKARKEMREDNAKIEVKKATSHCVKLYLDMNNELRGLTAQGLKSSNYGTTADNFSNMAQSYPKMCEDGLVNAGTSGKQLDMYDNYKDLEDLGNIVDVVTHYVSANSKSKALEVDGEKI